MTDTDEENKSVSYWNEFYKRNNKQIPQEPSSFARSVLAVLVNEHQQPVIELGVGNGRDAIYFAQHGIKVVGIDQSTTAIEKLQSLSEAKDNLIFFQRNFADLPTPFCFPYRTQFLNSPCVYSRFTLHSIDAQAASRALRWAFQNLRDDGLLLIEARSVLDNLYGKGTTVENEKDAFIYTHYRRFLRKTELISELKEIGFYIAFDQESKGLSVVKDDDPVLIRIHARKPKKKL